MSCHDHVEEVAVEAALSPPVRKRKLSPSAEPGVNVVCSSGSCLHPCRIINPHYDPKSKKGKINLEIFRTFHTEYYPINYWIDIPCGRCVGCQKDRARSWRVRLIHEHMYGNHKNCICVTLTIKQSDYESFKDSSLVSTRVREFLDRLRYYMPGRKLPKRFFITELGEDRERLHFHGFIWDIDVPYHKIRRCWTYGFIWVDRLKSVRQLVYATKYITKANCSVYRPQVFASPGLGKAYLQLRNWQKWHFADPKLGLRLFIDINGFRYSMPSYYRRKMFNSSEIYLYQTRLSESDEPRPKFLLGQKFEYARPYVAARSRLYENSLRLDKSRYLKAPAPIYENTNIIPDWSLKI
nr:MAG: replication initiation protein [Microviridae sp.]